MPHSDVRAEWKGKWIVVSGDTGLAPILPFFFILSLDEVALQAKWHFFQQSLLGTACTNQDGGVVRAFVRAFCPVLLQLSQSLGNMETNSCSAHSGAELLGLNLHFLSKRSHGSGSFCCFCLCPPNTGCGDPASHLPEVLARGFHGKRFFSWQAMLRAKICVLLCEYTARASSNLNALSSIQWILFFIIFISTENKGTDFFDYRILLSFVLAVSCASSPGFSWLLSQSPPAELSVFPKCTLPALYVCFL